MDYAIIVAGGKGMRMGGRLPKQFMEVGGKPILMYTLERFYHCQTHPTLILVLPKADQPFWHQLCTKHSFTIPHTVITGGETRFHSSLNGLTAIHDGIEGVVAIHDGVRPFVSPTVIDRCFDMARTHGACIPVIPVVDTLRQVGIDGSDRNVLRDNYRIVQTPQVFRTSLAKEAFRQPYREAFTDDASVVEHLGVTVSMVEGNRENIKITTPFDLIVAEALLRNEASHT